MEKNSFLDQDLGTTPSNQPVPNAGGTLTLGILSIVFAGLIGIILGVIALSISSAPKFDYENNPGKYREGSFKNLAAGRTCAIVGLSLSGLVLLIVIGMAVSH